MERKVGEGIIRELRRAHDIVDDVELSQYLNALGNTLVSHAPRAESDFYFFAVKDNTLNAFALPGGNIGVHTGLLLAAQSESELASVMAHEIGHVVQRHIARMLAKQGQDALVSVAALILAILAARSNPDAAQGIAMAGGSYQIQNQLNFSRDAEREADRVGLQILQGSGFNTHDMVTFFGRLQQAGRLYENNAPAYLRTHPLTTERMADIQGRVQDAPVIMRADSLDFTLLRAKLRASQDGSVNGLRETQKFLEHQLQQRTAPNEGASWFALAVTYSLQHNWVAAADALQHARSLLKAAHPILDRFEIELKLATGQNSAALTLAQSATQRFPQARALAQVYAQCLQANGQHVKAIAFLREQATLYRQEMELYPLLANSYAATGQHAQEHWATAEYLIRMGAYPAALEQLQQARRAGDTDFFQLSMIDARTHEVQQLVAEEAKERVR
ncbi:MAG: M48 family peptidase [Burkholderiaceae bacterium]|nr:MAG: M48 family peptidase [Burkholderiaceae bacterium]